ncbi:MAG: M56 family metallopeptidase [Blastocatellia bacterium]
MKASEFLWLLLDAGGKSTVLLLLALGLQWCWARWSAAQQHWLLALALGAGLSLPLLSWLLPSWRVPLLPVPAEIRTPQAVALPVVRIAYALPFDEFTFDPLLVEPLPPTWNWATLALAVWAIGAWIVAAQMLIGSVLVWLLRQGAQPLANKEWQAFVAEAAQSLWLRRQVPLYISPDATVPMTAGVFRPVVFLPQAASQWSREQLRTVLLHELAHVKRRDCLTQLLALLACALYWFNPLVWLAARQLRTTRELACDDEVLAAGTRASTYASCLVKVAQSVVAPTAKSVAPLAVGMACSQLSARVAAILDPARPRRAFSRRIWVMLMVLFVALFFPLASLQPFAQAPAVTPQAAAQKQEQRQREERIEVEIQRTLEQQHRILREQKLVLTQEQRQQLERELQRTAQLLDTDLTAARQRELEAELAQAARQMAEQEAHLNHAQQQLVERELQAARRMQEQLQVEQERRRARSGNTQRRARRAAEEAALAELEAQLKQNLPLQRAQLRRQITELEQQLESLRQVYKDAHPSVLERQARLLDALRKTRRNPSVNSFPSVSGVRSNWVFRSSKADD